ncbi:MAG: divalent-cation tolerance protein CutA [Dehalococcoidia bacterium]|jgi:periplasmic divalent cation tolerance protein
MTDFLQVTTTTAERADAEKIAKALVERRLAACVQILGPIASTYRWKRVVENAVEWLCLIKTEKRLLPELEQAIKEVHPYETPEILATAIEAGSRDYFAWLSDTLRQGALD